MTHGQRSPAKPASGLQTVWFDLCYKRAEYNALLLIMFESRAPSRKMPVFFPWVIGKCGDRPSIPEESPWGAVEGLPTDTRGPVAFWVSADP